MILTKVYFFFKITQLRLKKYYVSHYYVLTIRYQNNHVSPTEIEAILQTHPDVKESLVFGKKDPRVQELISAVVVLNEGSMVSQDSGPYLSIQYLQNECVYLHYLGIYSESLYILSINVQYPVEF